MDQDQEPRAIAHIRRELAQAEHTATLLRQELAQAEHTAAQIRRELDAALVAAGRRPTRGEDQPALFETSDQTTLF